MAHRRIQLSHGSGGRMMRALIDEEIVPRFGDGPLAGLPDAACVDLAAGRAVFTTDSFVVQPLEFPGGSIGDLAVFGTVNDIAVAGGRPRFLSLALILEEGLDRDVLARVLDAVHRAAGEAGVTVVTGDTKVVGRGQCDGMFVNTAGIGERIESLALDPRAVRPGDVVLASGPLGDHGMAVMAAREGIAIESGPVSDTAPVHRLVEAALVAAGGIRYMRDPTRGGVAGVLAELVEDRPFGVRLDERALPIAPGTRAVAEMLGIDLLHVACEGRVLLVAAADAAGTILDAWQALPEGRAAARIGDIVGEPGRVTIETSIGGERLIDLPEGEILPRIC